MSLKEQLYFIKQSNKRITEKLISTKHPELYSHILQRTAYLGDCRFNERLYHIEHDLYSRPVCPTCNTASCEWFYDYARYKQCCSHECFLKCPDRFAAIKETTLARYGSISPFGNSTVREKASYTIKTRYGVDNVMHDDTIKSNYKTSMIDKYGVPSNLLDGDTRASIRNTLKERYGVENVFAKGWKRDEITSKILEKYGTDNYQKSVISPESRLLLEDEGWLRQKLTVETLPIYEIATLLDCDPTTVSNWAHKYGIELTVQRESYLEQKVHDAIKAVYDGDIVRHDRTLIPPLELDFVFPDKKIAVEVCVNYWHSDKFKDNDYHRSKFLKCQEIGYQLLTVYEDEIHEKFDIVISSILNKLGCIPSSIYARTTKVVALSKKQKKEFLDKYHIQGNDRSTHAYGLISTTDELVAVISLFVNANSVLISRFATNQRVVGGFSKLLKHITTIWDSSYTISTFADLRWSLGNLYSSNGFIAKETIPVSYDYIKKNKRFHKFNFRKKIIKKRYNLDDGLTEKEMMQQLNFHRIYDCGKVKFVYSGCPK